MHIIIVLVIIGLFILYAIGRASGKADEQSEAMQLAMQQEQADAEAWERITR